jgi:ABC-type transport system involved in multi-copper enzyme maturation permease subunit
MNPIIRRELLDLLRTRKAVAVQVALALGCTLLVLIRWPTGGVSDLNGARAQQVLQVFGYGLLAGVLFLVPAFPATSLVREKISGTLALLLNSPMSAWSIYLGKLSGIMGFTALLLLVTAPAAAACYALGGVSARGGVGLLYLVLAVASLQVITLGLYVSSRAQSIDFALRVTYVLVLAIAILPLFPYLLLGGSSGPLTDLSNWLRCLSPLPAVVEVLGHSGIGSRGMVASGGVVTRYLILGTLMSGALAVATVWRLTHSPLDQARTAGIMTQDRSQSAQWLRRIFFLIDPQRRSGSLSLLVNPVMAKEFRSRRFGRSHWTLRLIALTAILSLALSYISATGALGWGSGAISGGLVILQTALLLLFVPSLAAGLISSEREGRTWNLLRMTPLSSGAILRGKLFSVAWPVVLLMCGTLPGYLVMAAIEPVSAANAWRVVLSLTLLAVFGVMLSATISSLVPSTATALAVANLIFVTISLGPLLLWLGQGVPFGFRTVETALTISPVAAALHAANFPGFGAYELLPLNWWIMGGASLVLLIVLVIRTRQLYRPE